MTGFFVGFGGVLSPEDRAALARSDFLGVYPEAIASHWTRAGGIPVERVQHVVHVEASNAQEAVRQVEAALGRDLDDPRVTS